MTESAGWVPNAPAPVPEVSYDPPAEPPAAAPAPEPPAEQPAEPAAEAPAVEEQEPGWLRDVADSYPVVAVALRELHKLIKG